jgi:hypothetical protein
MSIWFKSYVKYTMTNKNIRHNSDYYFTVCNEAWWSYILMTYICGDGQFRTLAGQFSANKVDNLVPDF